MAGADNRMSVAGELYDLVSGESERTLLGDLFAWVTCVHRVYVYIFIVVCDVLYLRGASSCALYHSNLWFIEAQRRCCSRMRVAVRQMPYRAALPTVNAHREEFFKCLFPPSVLTVFLLVV